MAADALQATQPRFEPYPAYKDSGVEWLGEIPAHWDIKPIKFHVPPRRGRLEPKPDEATYVALENIESWTGRLALDNQPEEVESVVASFRAGDVLFGKLRPYLAKVARPNFDGVCSSEIVPLKPTDEALQSYVMYCLVDAEYIAWVDSLTYGTKMPRVHPSVIGRSALPVPSLPEQRAIAAFLDRETARIDAMVAKMARLIELLAEKRAALITRAVTKGLDPNAPMKDSGVEWLGEVPAHWEILRVKDLSRLGAGDAITSDDIDRSGEYAVFGGNGLRGYTSSYNREGDFPLIGRQGALCGCVTLAQGRFWASEHAIVANTAGGVDARWLARLFGAMRLHSYSQSAAQPGIAVEVISAVAAPRPPPAEQCAIAAFLDAEGANFDALIAKVRSAIERLQELRSALISAAVTGRIDVRGAA